MSLLEPMVTASFLSTLFLASAVQVAAQPVDGKACCDCETSSLAQLSFAKRVIASPYSILNLDRLRVNVIKGLNIFEVISSPAENDVSTMYIASVGVGSPPTSCK